MVEIGVKTLCAPFICLEIGDFFKEGKNCVKKLKIVQNGARNSNLPQIELLGQKRGDILKFNKRLLSKT